MQTALVGVRCLVETQVRQPGQTTQQHWCLSASALLGRLPGAWHGMPFSVIVHVSLTFATLPLFRLPHLHKHYKRLMHCVASHGTLYSAMYSSERPAHSAVQESYCSHYCCVQAYKNGLTNPMSSNASSKGDLMVLTEIQSVPMHYEHTTDNTKHVHMCNKQCPVHSERCITVCRLPHILRVSSRTFKGSLKKHTLFRSHTKSIMTTNSIIQHMLDLYRASQCHQLQTRLTMFRECCAWQA